MFSDNQGRGGKEAAVFGKAGDMIAKLKGVLDFTGDGFLILDVNGVGYRVFASNKTLAKMPPVGQGASVLIETQVREDHIHATPTKRPCCATLPTPPKRGGFPC